MEVGRTISLDSTFSESGAPFHFTYASVYDHAELDGEHKVVIPKVFMPGAEDVGKLTNSLVYKWLGKALRRDITGVWILSRKASEWMLLPFDWLPCESPFVDGVVVVVSSDGTKPPSDTASRLHRQRRTTFKSLIQSAFSWVGTHAEDSSDKEFSLADSFALLSPPKSELKKLLSDARKKRRKTKAMSKTQADLEISFKLRGKHEDRGAYGSAVSSVPPDVDFPIEDRTKAEESEGLTEAVLVFPSSITHPGVALRTGPSPRGFIACL